jgi:DNA-binding beta-propeller fold protein YncE
MHQHFISAFAIGVSVVAPLLMPDETMGQAQKVVLKTVVEGLNNPCGIAIQPSTGVIFVSDSGNGQVIRVVDGKKKLAIIGFPTETYGLKTSYQIGPLGLVFLSQNTLVVGGGGQPNGKDALSVYQLPENQSVIDAAQTTRKFQLSPQLDIPGEGNFYGLAVTPDRLFATCNGDDTQGWIASATRTNNQLDNFRREISTRKVLSVDAPTGIATSHDGKIFVSHMGEMDISSDSVLAIYNTEGKILSSFQTGLNDIVGVAFAPSSNRVFVIDFSAMNPEKGGLYEIRDLDSAKRTCKTKLVTSFSHPTAMAFHPDGSLLVTSLGPGTKLAHDSDGNAELHGSLFQISGWENNE